MTTSTCRRLFLVLRLAAVLVCALPALAATPALPDHWVGTWATAPYALEDAQAISDLGFGTTDMTLRQVVHTSLAGPLVRVELTNEFGVEPLTIGAVHIALTGAAAGDISLMSANALTFNGVPTITLPPGASVVSDPAALAVPAGGDVTVSIFLPAQKISTPTYHGAAYTSNFLVPGNVVGARSFSPAAGQGSALPKTLTSWFFLKAVDVRTPPATGAVVAFGDSITDGAGSTMNANTRWPDVLARRLHADKKTAGLSVLNEGIGGNRLLHQGTGPNALARFDRDVLGQSGVRYLILLEGINDIGRAFDAENPYDIVSANDLIQGLAQLAERAHAHGIKVFGATLTPYGGAGYSSPSGEQARQALNAWIRTTKVLDGFIDFDKATSDPAHPDSFLPSYDCGDHLHPKDAGYKAMGDSIDLKLFVPNKQEKYDITHQQ